MWSVVRMSPIPIISRLKTICSIVIQSGYKPGIVATTRVTMGNMRLNPSSLEGVDDRLCYGNSPIAAAGLDRNGLVTGLHVKLDSAIRHCLVSDAIHRLARAAPVQEHWPCRSTPGLVHDNGKTDARIAVECALVMTIGNGRSTPGTGPS